MLEVLLAIAEELEPGTPYAIGGGAVLLSGLAWRIASRLQRIESLLETALEAGRERSAKLAELEQRMLNVERSITS